LVHNTRAVLLIGHVTQAIQLQCVTQGAKTSHA